MKYFIKTDKISNLHEISRKVARLDVEADVKQGRFTVDINSIGQHRLRAIISEDYGCKYHLMMGRTIKIKRKAFEVFLNEAEQI